MKPLGSALLGAWLVLSGLFLANIINTDWSVVGIPGVVVGGVILLETFGLLNS